MKFFCFLVSVPRQPTGAHCTPVARLSLCREEAERHPLRVSEVVEIDIHPVLRTAQVLRTTRDSRLIEHQLIETQPRPQRAEAVLATERTGAAYETDQEQSNHEC